MSISVGKSILGVDKVACGRRTTTTTAATVSG